MEILFRKYFWAVNLLFLLLAALLVARTMNVFTEGALAGGPDTSTPSTAPRPVYAVPTRIDPTAFSLITGIPLPAADVAIREPTLAEGAAAAGKEDLNSTPVHTTLHVRLLGTTVSTNVLWSFAVIEDTQAHTNDTYMVDDKVQGAKVLEIRDDCSDLSKSETAQGCVIVVNNNRREFIDDKEGNGPVASIVAPVASTEAPPSNANGTGIRAVGDNKYTVPKSELDKTLGNLNDVAMQARIVPAFKDGVATGFKLFSIRPDSIYSKIGVQNGDVIRRINGFEINSPDKALEAYSKLKEANHIEIEIDRNGSSVNKQYDITP